jgi:hypothetical protein
MWALGCIILWVGLLLWRHRFLINPNRRSTRLTVVKSRSTWVLTSKNSPTNSNDTLDLVDIHVGPTMVKDLVKPHLNPSIHRCLSELLPRSKFQLNTSKSTFMKVVQLVEGHNFHVDWHFKFWVEKHEKLAHRSVRPVHDKWVAFKVGKSLLQNLLRKTLYSLFESGRGYLDLQLLYSTFDALVFKKWSYSFSNRCSATRVEPERRRAATLRTPLHAARRAAHRLPWRPHPRRARGLTPPEPHLPQVHAPRGISFSPHTTHHPPPAPCARAERTAGPSAVPHTGTTAASPPSSGHHRREHAPYLRSLTPLMRTPSRRRSSRSTASAIDGRSVKLPSAFTPSFPLVQIAS